MVDTVSILLEVQDRYGLTNLEMLHYKSTETQRYDGPVRFILAPRSIITQTVLGPELLKAKNVLLVYEQKSLGTLIFVLKKKEDEPLETII